jgi:hypothetical protein
MRINSLLGFQRAANELRQREKQPKSTDPDAPLATTIFTDWSES